MAASPGAAIFIYQLALGAPGASSVKFHLPVQPDGNSKLVHKRTETTDRWGFIMFNCCFGILTPRLMARWNNYAKDRRGAAAVEFAMIALPFFLLIFGLLEICLLFIVSTVLEHSVTEASRQIRTGQAQEGGFNEQNFRNSVCAKFFGLLDCDAKLHIDVKSLTGFGQTDLSSPIDEDGNFDDQGFAYEPGGPNDIVAVRVFYEWNLMTPVLSTPMSNMSGSKYLIQSNAVFRNEPFGD
jgi:Flp pilus assembly protein TadG